MKRVLFPFLLLALCSSCHPPELPLLDFEICDNNRDDNGDGFLDCDDDECAQDEACAHLERCDDNIDNDFNGDTDCQDEACAGTTDCLCIGTAAIFSSQLPITFEGDSAEGVEAGNVNGCQTGDALESFFNLSFPGLTSVDVLVESLEGVELVLQTTNDCGENNAFTCSRNNSAGPLNVTRFDVSGGPTLFFVGARQAGQTGRFRITFSLPQ